MTWVMNVGKAVFRHYNDGRWGLREMQTDEPVCSENFNIQ